MKYFLGTDIGLLTYNYGQTSVILDTDASGDLSSAEITAFNSSTYSSNPLLGGVTGTTLVANFATYDLNSDSSLSQSEL